MGLTLLFVRRRGSPLTEMEEVLQHAMAPSGPPVSTTSHHKEVPTIAQDTALDEPSAPQHSPLSGPPLPEDGLPPGWSEEQWQYYGQQYLDGTL